MDTQPLETGDRRARGDPLEIPLRIGIAVLAFTTSYIHSTLGGLLFTLNAVGFAVLGIAVLVPFGRLVSARYGRPLGTLMQLALLAFAAATMTGWILFGARFDLGYYATSIEVGIVALVAVNLWRTMRRPIAVIRELTSLAPPPIRHGVVERLLPSDWADRRSYPSLEGNA